MGSHIGGNSCKYWHCLLSIPVSDLMDDVKAEITQDLRTANVIAIGAEIGNPAFVLYSFSILWKGAFK